MQKNDPMSLRRGRKAKQICYNQNKPLHIKQLGIKRRGSYSRITTTTTSALFLVEASCESLLAKKGKM